LIGEITYKNVESCNKMENW